MDDVENGGDAPNAQPARPIIATAGEKMRMNIAKVFHFTAACVIYAGI